VTDGVAYSDALTVWASLPLPHVQLIQQMADNHFTPETGIVVNVSVMPGDQRLILSNAAGRAPDVAKGLGSGRPFQLGIRGAARDLAEFPDFFDFAYANINPETLVPFMYNDKVFGITETMNFYVMFYRKDILGALDIAPPDTWEDVKAIMPALKRANKTFHTPVSSSPYKSFHATAPFIYQMGGRLYAGDGMSVAFTDPNTLAGLTLLTDLFRLFSLPLETPNFYNDFRYGLIPLGVADFWTYIWLKQAAPELEGKWGILPSPGVFCETAGEVKRYQIAADASIIITEQSERPNDAWEYIKWWLSTETQIRFGYSLQVNYGPEYMWNSANLAAFDQMPIDENDKKVIREQWRWIRELPPHPAAYIVERTISDLWNEVVLDGAPLRLSADKFAVEANREIILKLTEFGYIIDGEPVKPYNTRER